MDFLLRGIDLYRSLLRYSARMTVAITPGGGMFNPTAYVIEGFITRLEEIYFQTFGQEEPGYPGTLGVVARAALERIADSDALYHNLEHTIMVTLVGQQILRGKRIVDGNVTTSDWLHFLCALLCHDIGYVRGVCNGDRGDSVVIDEHGTLDTLPRGASDAALTPYHIERGKRFVRERCRDVPELDEERIAAAIELTRFPVPADGDHQETNTEPALVRAADLIGQLADPLYPRKSNALFCEFRETGVASEHGYASPADLWESYPKFYWNMVRPYIGSALHYLRVTQDGKQWIAHLHANVFAAEHGDLLIGTQPGEVPR